MCTSDVKYRKFSYIEQFLLVQNIQLLIFLRVLKHLKPTRKFYGQ